MQSKGQKKMNPKSLKNLKPFPKGNKASTGRPRIPLEEKQARQLLKDINSDLTKELIANGKYKKLMMLAIESSCKSGRFDAFKFLNDYNGNKPIDEVETNVQFVAPIVYIPENGRDTEKEN